MRSPVSRDDMWRHRFIVPPPVGCTDCDKADADAWDDFWYSSAGCRHVRHFEAIANEFIKRGLAYVEAGSYRRCFISKNGRWVYKVPFDDAGYQDNFYEACAWRDRAHLVSNGISIGHRVARCRLLPSGVLVMERMLHGKRWRLNAVQIDQTLRADPARHAIPHVDACQGGLDRQGLFRLYDYTHWTEIKDPIPSSLMAL